MGKGCLCRVCRESSFLTFRGKFTIRNFGSRHVFFSEKSDLILFLNCSFMGGTNFWGGTKEDDCFLAPSFDDKILEVVAVFDSMQMAASRLINLQHHRIAQCHSIKITILGDEPIPIQVQIVDRSLKLAQISRILNNFNLKFTEDQNFPKKIMQETCSKLNYMILF